MDEAALQSAIARIPAGSWAAGISGGADSVALLMLLLQRDDLKVHVVHLDHQTRGEQSAADADFVAQLCQKWKTSFSIARREEIERHAADLPANPSAKYRAIRLELFRKVIETHQLQGVILAHHADDQAETILHRLIRGSPYSGLTGMRESTTIGGLTILRPLLAIHHVELVQFLEDRHQTWREDASNQSDDYLRNRLRKILSSRPHLADTLIRLGEQSARLLDWTTEAARKYPAQIRIIELQRLPNILLETSLRHWLIEQGLPADRADGNTIERVIQMVIDAASPARQSLAENIFIRRRAGVLFIERETS